MKREDAGVKRTSANWSSPELFKNPTRLPNRRKNSVNYISYSFFFFKEPLSILLPKNKCLEINIGELDI